MKQARIQLEPITGTSSVVIVDGNGTEHDITNAVSSCVVTRDQRGNCSAIVTMPRVLVAAEAEIEVSPETRDALLALGWTPPQDS